MERKTEALIRLLFDDDQKIAVQAMQALVENNESVNELLSIFQDSDDPKVRRRIYELSTALRHAELADELAESFKEKMATLESVIKLASYFDFNVKYDFVMQALDQLAIKFKAYCQKHGGTLFQTNLVNFMRLNKFFVPETFTIEHETFLINKVLDYSLGSPIILSVIGQFLSEYMNHPFSIVIYEGHFALLDCEKNLLEPNFSWKVSLLENTKKCYTCTRNEVFLNVLSSLFLAVNQDGTITEINLISKLLTKVVGGSCNDLPYPIGGENTYNI